MTAPLTNSTVQAITQDISQNIATPLSSSDGRSRPPVLVAQRVSGGYDDRAIVRDVSLTLHSGEWLSLIGANGSGKSTLLRLFGRLLVPQSGQIRLDGRPIAEFSACDFARVLAVQAQEPPLIPAELTVRQLVSLGRSPHRPWWQWTQTAVDRDQVEAAIVDTDLTRLAHRPVVQLSGGERQRAFLALALAQNPRVLLLDEPTTFLDVRYQLELLELLARLNRDRGLSIITVLHELDLAARYSHRLVLIQEGRAIEVGTPATVLTPDNLRRAFGIEAIVLSTSAGLKVCPLSATRG
ncbi:MAG: ABC transporter ATP-binding protein [Oscillatoriales cyanobacterium]|nr:MAG: ABC transporter ATP-binding protein [Oscillatoriales cyanobacterium]